MFIAGERVRSTVGAGRRDGRLQARTAVGFGGIERTVARVQAYAATGVDAIFVVEADTLAQIEAVHAAVDLPLIVGSGAPALKREALAQLGGRILLQGHQSLAAAVEALHDVYTHLHNGGEPAGLQMKVASGEKMDCLVRGEEHRQWQRLYLR